MGKWKHRLGNIDHEASTAICAECGPVGTEISSGVVRCRTSKRSTRNTSRRYDYNSEAGGFSLQTGERDLLLSGAKCVCGSTKGLVVDHCHVTGTAPRGILCRECNIVLGLVKDDPETLMKLVDYLNKK